MSDEDITISKSKAAPPALHQVNKPGVFSFRCKLDEMAAPYATQPIRRYDIWTVFAEELPVLWNETNGNGQRVTYEAWLERNDDGPRQKFVSRKFNAVHRPFPLGFVTPADDRWR